MGKCRIFAKKPAMIRLFITLLCIVFSFSLSAQSADGETKEIHVFLYTFENLTQPEQIDALIADVKKIPGIVEAKVNAKWESNRGELIFKTEEIITGNENAENIDIAPVKQAIQALGMTPVECKERLPR